MNTDIWWFGTLVYYDGPQIWISISVDRTPFICIRLDNVEYPDHCIATQVDKDKMRLFLLGHISIKELLQGIETGYLASYEEEQCIKLTDNIKPVAEFIDARELVLSNKVIDNHLKHYRLLKLQDADINKVKNLFDGYLDDWDIEPGEIELRRDFCYPYQNSVSYDNKTRKAIIYPCTNNVCIPFYIFHELLHVAFVELRSRKGDKNDKEERLIRLICGLFFNATEYGMSYAPQDN